MSELTIHTRSQPLCGLCGSGGNIVYENQTDRLFGAPGSWRHRRCSSPKCGTIWLDPMPLEGDLHKAYANYYTHASRSESAARRPLRNLTAAYLSREFGYRDGKNWLASLVLAYCLRLLPLRCAEARDEVRHLPHIPQGRLLDVGCGSGDWLNYMRSYGWRVFGVDSDPEAVAACQRRSLPVRLGNLDECGYEPSSFDAITLNHVIEHLPDPIATLQECARLLRPNGKLVLSTPNGASLSHSAYGANWRGLEPPRHLHIFTPESLRESLHRAGFEVVTLHPQVATSVILESELLKRGRYPGNVKSRGLRILEHAVGTAELLVASFRPSLADCVTAVACRG